MAEALSYYSVHYKQPRSCALRSLTFLAADSFEASRKAKPRLLRGAWVEYGITKDSSAFVAPKRG